ncbi:MAG: aminotransferase class III-fold pyridoxal phosphate-dependent enzyme, partial [Candidatus Dadabacteria bacterium]
YVVDTLSKTSFLERVRELGSAFLRELFRIKESCKWHVREIRGIGLMVAVDFGSGAKAFQRKLADNGLICTTLGDEVLRFLPPLNLSDEDLEEAVDIVEETCINQ